MRPLPRVYTAYLTEASRDQSPLEAGDVYRDVDGAYHLIQYVNSSGAYSVPLAAVERTIAGRTTHFTGGGRTISVWSAVNRINPLQMGGNSQEYRRYVRMVSALEGDGMAKRKKEGPGAQFDSFDSTPIEEMESLAADGHSAGDGTATPSTEADMAKKAAKKATKKEKVVKEVRACACGCDGETTSYFVPGHDARMHGWIKKLADGRIDIKGKDAKSGEVIIPGAVLKQLQLTATAKGAKAGAPHFWKSE